MTNSNYLPSKGRYDILDGLRGVAALLVLAYHQFDVYHAGNPAHCIVNHGYLAVDFFFMLSGFVIGYAYEDRWERMSLKDFFKRRLVRLHPMIIAATVTGVCCFYFTAGEVFPLVMDTPVWMLMLCALLSILMIPTPPSLDIRGWNEVNSIAGTIWSLFYEYIANILYALIIRKFSRTMLVIFVIASGFLTLNLALDLDVFHLFVDREGPRYTMIGGWTLDVPQTFIGFTRLLFPFFAGLLLSHIGKRIELKAGFWWCSLLLFTLLVMPRVGGAEHGILNGIYESACIIILFPLLIAMGAGSRVSGKSARVCKFLGDISYPLYITQQPFLYILFTWVDLHPDASFGQTLAVNLAHFSICIFVAYAWLKLYDEPVREWLRVHWLMGKRKVTRP